MKREERSDPGTTYEGSDTDKPRKREGRREGHVSEYPKVPQEEGARVPAIPDDEEETGGVRAQPVEAPDRSIAPERPGRGGEQE